MTDSPEFLERIQRNRAIRMNKVDNASPELRALFNDYGTSLINQFMTVGVRKPKQIRHLIEAVLNDLSPTRGSYSIQGIKTHVRQ